MVCGSPADAQLLHSDAPVFAPNMFASGGKGYCDFALEAFDCFVADNPGARPRVVGFSIGAMGAVHIAAHRPGAVEALALVSAAAPLALGDFLPHMAGRQIFQLARKPGQGALTFATKAQSLALRLAPQFLMSQMFRGAGAAEMALMQDASFPDILRAGMQNGFQSYPKAYMATLAEYVSDWSAQLGRVHCPVSIWHGAEDTWAPVAMAHALERALGGPAELHILDGAEHYSTLAKVRL